MKKMWRAIDFGNGTDFNSFLILCSSKSKSDCKKAVEARIKETNGECDCHIYFN